MNETLLEAQEKGELFESSVEHISYWLEADFMPKWVKASIEELISKNAWELIIFSEPGGSRGLRSSTFASRTSKSAFSKVC